MIREVSWMILGSIALAGLLTALLSLAAATSGDRWDAKFFRFMTLASMLLLGFMVFLYANE